MNGIALRKGYLVGGLFVAIVGAGIVSGLSPEVSRLETEAPPVAEGMRAETTADSRLMLTAEAAQARAGDRIVVIAQVDPGENRVSGAEIEVNYDPKKLRLEEIEPSEAFSLELAKATIDSGKGLGSVALGVPLESPSIAETTVIARYVFRALQSAGSATVAFTGKSIVAADYEPGNVVKEKIPATITLSAGGE